MDVARNSIFTRTRYFPMIDGDMPTFMGFRWRPDHGISKVSMW